MTSQDYDLVCGFANDVVSLDAQKMWQHYNLPSSDAGKASLRLIALRVAFVALGLQYARKESKTHQKGCAKTSDEASGQKGCQSVANS